MVESCFSNIGEWRPATALTIVLHHGCIHVFFPKILRIATLFLYSVKYGEAYMTSPDWSENFLSFSSRSFHLNEESKIFSLQLFFLSFSPSHFCNFNPYLDGYFVKIVGNNKRPDVVSTLATCKIVRRKRNQKFLASKKFHATGKFVFALELWHVKWMACTTQKAVILKFPQIKLNRIKVNMSCFSARSITRNISEKRWKAGKTILFGYFCKTN